MKVAFYKYEHGNYEDWLIAKATSSKFSHVELIFDDGYSFSSSPRDNGVRFKKINYVPEKWEIIDLKVSDLRKINIERKAKSIVRKKYEYDRVAIYCGWAGIRSYGKFICSDVISYLLFDIMEFTTPQELYEMVS